MLWCSTTGWIWTAVCKIMDPGWESLYSYFIMGQPQRDYWLKHVSVGLLSVMDNLQSTETCMHHHGDSETTPLLHPFENVGYRFSDSDIKERFITILPQVTDSTVASTVLECLCVPIELFIALLDDKHLRTALHVPDALPETPFSNIPDKDCWVKW